MPWVVQLVHLNTRAFGFGYDATASVRVKAQDGFGCRPEPDGQGGTTTSPTTTHPCKDETLPSWTGVFGFFMGESPEKSLQVHLVAS